MVAALALVWGCGSSDDTVTGLDGSPTDGGSTDTGGEPTVGDTGGPGEDTGTGTSTPVTTPSGVELSVACAPTDNVLRFTCTVGADPAADVELRYQRADGTGTARVRPGEALAAQDIALWFLAPSSTYRVEAAVVGDPDGSGAVTTVTTAALPSAVDAEMTVTGTSSTGLLGTNLSCSSNAAVAGVFDTSSGELVWYQVLDTTGSFGGFDMVQFTEDHTVLGQSGDTIVEVDLAGNDLLRKAYTDDFHHDLFRRHGKTWILFAETSGSAKLDGFVVWDAAGNELSRWREADHLDIPASARGDWAHTNSIWVGEDERVLLSLHTQDTLVSVSPSGDTEWVLQGTSTGELGQDYATDWSATSGADAFGSQHAASFAPDGRLLLLDNDHGRGLVGTLDESGLHATFDESYATASSTCGPQGTTTTTAAGNVLVGCSGAQLREYEPGATTPVFTAAVTCANGQAGGGGGGGGASGPVRIYPLDGW